MELQEKEEDKDINHTGKLIKKNKDSWCLLTGALTMCFYHVTYTF